MGRLSDLPLQEKVRYLNEIRGHYAAMYLDVRKGAGYVEKRRLLARKHQKVIAKDLRQLYRALVAKVGPLGPWVEKGRKLRTVKKGLLRKAYVKGGTATDNPEIQNEIFQQMMAAAEIGGESYDPYLGEIDDDFAQEADDSSELSLISIGATVAMAMSIGLTGKPNATDAEIQAAWKAQFPNLSVGMIDQIKLSMETTLKTLAGLTVNASDPEDPLDLESLDATVDDLITLQAEAVAEGSSANILAQVEAATMAANNMEVDQWVTHPELTASGPCKVCLSNESNGPDESGMFDSDQFGPVSTPPAHNHCECTVDSTKGKPDLENLNPPSEQSFDDLQNEEDTTS